MEWSHEYADAIDRLDLLDEFDTFSPYCRAFYRLIVDWIEQCHEAAPNLYVIFLSFLEDELQHHSALRDAGMESVRDLPEWTEICCHKALVLHKTLAQLIAIPNVPGPSAVVKHLLCAECFHQLGRGDLVVLGMRAAIEQGCNHPLVYFSLGYNLYMRAIRNYTTFDPSTNRQIIQDPLMFEQECRQAIAAMHRGVCDSPYDAQLFWWMGSILENISDVNEARVAFLQVAELDPETYGEAVDEKLRLLTRPIPDAVSDEERVRLSQLPEITVDEILDAFRNVESIRDLVERAPRQVEGRPLQGAD